MGQGSIWFYHGWRRWGIGNEEFRTCHERGAPAVVMYLGVAVDCDAHHMADPRFDELGVSSCIKSILEGADVTHPIPVEEEVLNVSSSSHGEWALLNISSLVTGYEGWAGPHNVIFWSSDYSGTFSHHMTTYSMVTIRPLVTLQNPSLSF